MNYHIFQTIRHTYVLEEENRKKKFWSKKCGKIFNNINNIIFHKCKCKLHSDYKIPPFSSQIWEGIVHLIVRKMRYPLYLYKMTVLESCYLLYLEVYFVSVKYDYSHFSLDSICLEFYLSPRHSKSIFFSLWEMCLPKTTYSWVLFLTYPFTLRLFIDEFSSLHSV